MNKRLDDYLNPYDASRLMMNAAERRIRRSMEYINEIEELLKSIRREYQRQKQEEAKK